MKRARAAALKGDVSSMRINLIGNGHPNRSVYEQLHDVSHAVAFSFFSCVKVQLDRLQERLDKFHAAFGE